jgi:hypothetical protein
MVHRNLDPDAVANLHVGDVDALGGNTDQPDMAVDAAGRLAAPQDAAEYTGPAGGMSTENAGALVGKPKAEPKKATGKAG